MKKRALTTWLTSLALGAAFLTGPTPARASTYMTGGFVLGVGLLVAGGGLVLSSAGSIIGSAMGGAGAQEVSRAGYVLGGLNVFLGAIALTFGAGNSLEQPQRRWVLGVGAGQVVLGGLDIGLTLWARQRHKSRPRMALRVVPLALVDNAGRPALGAGFRLAEF